MPLRRACAVLAALTVLSANSVAAQVVPVAPGWLPAPRLAPQTPASGVATTASPREAAPPQGLTTGPGEVFEIVPLRYADVSEVVGLLSGDATVRPNDGFTPQEPNFGSSALQSYYGGYSGGLPSSPLGPSYATAGASNDSVGRAIDGTIGIDRRLNAIILKGSPERVAALRAEIAKLDVPVTSVVLETVFVELTESGARNLGLDFNNGASQVATAAYAYSNGFPGVADTPPRGGVTVNLQAALYAQIAKGNGRIISKPRIAAQSGASAKIVTGDALPILTSIALSGVNAVQQQVQYVNVGVTLQIAPRVSDDGFVTSHVFAVVSSVTGFSQGYPTISQREASTSATVRDGDSFVIGGLTQETDLTNRSKLPGLGDVPALGRLFDVDHSTRTKTDLYIVVTPHVVRGGAKGAVALPDPISPPQK